MMYIRVTGVRPSLQLIIRSQLSCSVLSSCESVMCASDIMGVIVNKDYTVIQCCVLGIPYIRHQLFCNLDGVLDITDIVREGPFDAGTDPMDTEDSPLIITGMPGCPYRMTSYTGTALMDADAAYGLQLHHPRFLEFIGSPESARLLNHSPSFWVNRLGEECAMAAAVNLQRDAGLMMSNLQILAQFVTSLHRMSSEMMSTGVGHVVFSVEEVENLSTIPRAQRAAKYMTGMGMWRPPSGPGAPGRLPASTCPSCMKCEYCFGRREPSAQ